LQTKSLRERNLFCLGNVLTVVSDRKIAVDANNDNIVDYFIADIVSSTDYYSFGAPMAGRTFNSNSYKYGFNGKENDPETVGTGSGTQDYGMRIYNPALGKFLSIDPLTKKYAWNSTYAFAENDVIRANDLDGLEKNFQIQYKDKTGTLLWHTVAYSQIHPGQEYGPLGQGDYVYYKDEKSGKAVGKYNETYEEANPIRSSLQSADRRYEGKKGFKTLTKDLGTKAAPVVKAIGIVAVPFNPALGIAIYEVGGTIEKVSAGMEIITDIDEKNGKNLAIDLGTAFVEGYISHKVTIPNENHKVGTFIRNVIKEKLKEGTSEKKVESKKTIIRSKF
jgi:RHS repeat-associated protein